jgi:DNA processing protein
MDQTTTKYWLALKLVSRLSVEKKLFLVETFGLEGLFLLSALQLTQARLSAKQISQITKPDWVFINTIIEATQSIGANIITYEHAHYPQQLKQLYDPPLILFTLGNISLLVQQQIAIVGSRHATYSAIAFTKKLAEQIARHNLIITSGLALGIDGAAHQGAFIDNQAQTIAVVATGLDKVYPPRHKALATNIVQHNGLIVSEFLPGTSPKVGHFPRRNRVISGLSLGVVVVEAEIKSGSLITARCALEQNKEVFAVPGSVFNPMSKGCHWLIKQGAKLIEECADILDELNLTDVSVPAQEKLLKKNSNQDLFIDSLLASVDYEVTAIDMIVLRCKLAIDEVLTQLTVLELKGLVKAVPGGYIRIK